MKLSVSLDDQDVAFIDEFAAAHHVRSRSAVIQRALRNLRAEESVDAYVSAFREQADQDPNEWDAIYPEGLDQ